MSTLSTLIFTFFFILLVTTAGSLLRHLATARIPPTLEPVAGSLGKRGI